jgi:DNA repair exonuclease SbcCD ATPase subunit
MAPRLKTLMIENFRSLRGRVVIPLDAQVVLIHGTNGMGKTSVLSALELGLTGKIAHLAANGDGYRSYLTTLDTGGGAIELTISEPHKQDAAVDGTIDFGDGSFEQKPLLDEIDARFFAERCYLPQATLGRLLEIYDDHETSTTSPLTQFVKELLGLDPLDALIDGLHPAYHVTRVRNLVPEYRRLETLRSSLRDQIAQYDTAIFAATHSLTERLGALNATLAGLLPEPSVVVQATTDFERLRTQLETARDEERVLSDLSRRRSELRVVTDRWRSLPKADLSHDRASKERQEQAASVALQAWRGSAGKELDEIITSLRASFSNIPSIDDDPEESRRFAEDRASAEATRCSTLVTRSAAAAARVNTLNITVQRATTRIEELNKALSAGIEDARSLANALAGVASHLGDEACPVCDRNFAELSIGPLSAHVAAKIASLTSEAGRLQSLANERAEESARLSIAQRDLLSAGDSQLPVDAQAELMVRPAQMTASAQRLKGLTNAATTGAKLMVDAAAAREAVAAARRRDEQSSSLLPEIDGIVLSLIGQPASGFESIDAALQEADRSLNERIGRAQAVVSLRIQALSELDLYTKRLAQVAAADDEKQQANSRLSVAEDAIRQVDDCRDRAKKVGDAADSVRSDIVKTVFNTSLNKVWRDLFVRLAPSEQFVPAFKLPAGDGGKVEAVLETLHRSGKSSGSPTAMLSQGNLNTAALTLFLALHLSVPSRMPWLVLDDPVQSMDDLHIAQFAALLRSLSKGMGRQLIVAVHERALFDYLTLELSPAFATDSLICVELTRNFSGDAVATPQVFVYEDDRAIAA